MNEPVNNCQSLNSVKVRRVLRKITLFNFSDVANKRFIVRL